MDIKFLEDNSNQFLATIHNAIYHPRKGDTIVINNRGWTVSKVVVNIDDGKVYASLSQI